MAEALEPQNRDGLASGAPRRSGGVTRETWYRIKVDQPEVARVVLAGCWRTEGVSRQSPLWGGWCLPMGQRVGKGCVKRACDGVGHALSVAVFRFGSRVGRFQS
jgi:hypothetical protein